MLGCLQKREMLNKSSIDADRLVEWGKACEEEGLLNDAIDFYTAAGSSEEMESLFAQAVDEGDAFIYGKLLKAVGREASTEEWMALGKRAEELGKDAFARAASKRAGVEVEEKTGSTSEAVK